MAIIGALSRDIGRMGGAFESLLRDQSENYALLLTPVWPKERTRLHRDKEGS